MPSKPDHTLHPGMGRYWTCKYHVGDLVVKLPLYKLLFMLFFRAGFNPKGSLLLMDKILHDPKDPKLWELWYIPYNG